MRRLVLRLIPLFLLACSGPLESTQRQADLHGRVSIKLYVLDEERGPIAFAAREVTNTLNGSEALVERRSRFATPIPEDAVVLGTRSAFEASGSPFAPPPQGEEAFRIQITEVGGRKSIYVIGADTDGVLYGALELCEQVVTRSQVAVLQRPQEIARVAQLKRRGLTLAITAPAEPGDWWFRDEELWRRFLDDLARARFNRLDLRASWCLPWLVVPQGYEHRTVARTEADLNLRALARLTEFASDRGIDVGLISLGTAPWLPQHGPMPAASDVAMAQPFLERALPLLCARVPRLHALGFESGPGDTRDSVAAANQQVQTAAGRRIAGLTASESFGYLPLAYPLDVAECAARAGALGGARLHWDIAPVGASWRPAADPELVQRTIPTLSLLDSQGMALHLGDASTNAEHLRRLWPTLFVWGRLAFDPKSAASLTASFRDRFGSEAGPHVMAGLALTSRLDARARSIRSDLHVQGDGLDGWTWGHPADPRWQMGAQEYAVRSAWAAPARAASVDVTEASFALGGRLVRAGSGRRTPVQAADELLALADRAVAEFAAAHPLLRTRAEEFAAHAADAAEVVRFARRTAHYAKAGACMALYPQTLDPHWLDQCAAELRAAELPGMPVDPRELEQVASLRAQHDQRFGATAPVRRVTLLRGDDRATFPRPVVEIRVDTGKGNTRTVDASARAGELPDDLNVFLCVEPAGNSNQATRVRMQQRGDWFAAQTVLGHAGGTVHLEFIRRDGTAMLYPDPDAAMPFVLVPPRRGAELLPEPSVAERLDALSAEDLARFSCVLIGSQATSDAAVWASLLRIAHSGATVVVFAQKEPDSDVLPRLPGGLTRSWPTERIAWRAPEALAPLVEGLPEEWQPGRQQYFLAGGDDQWARVGEPAVVAVRAHGQGRLIAVQADILTILGQPVAERVLRNVLKFAGALTGDKPALIAHPGDGGLPLALDAEPRHAEPQPLIAATLNRSHTEPQPL